MEYKKGKRNRPISYAIKGYLDKEGGKVSVSRNEIEWRFNALDWRYQKQILFAFLQSGMSDRKWAYKKLYALWDDCFIPTIMDLWESYHEIEVSWLIIRFFPVDYLKQNFECLSAGRNYYFLFCRLYDEPDFVLDKTRLNEADLLSAKLKLDETITDADIRDMFYLLIYKMCKGVYKYRVYEVLYESQPLLSIFRCSLVETMNRIIAHDLENYRLADEFQNWMVSVSKGFQNDCYNLSDLDYYSEREKVREIMRGYCLKYIDPKYKDVWDTFDINDKQRFLDYLEERHNARMLNYNPEVKKEHDDSEIKTMREVEERFGSPSVEKLIDRFDLEMANIEELPF
jgi:hypothetical protein